MSKDFTIRLLSAGILLYSLMFYSNVLASSADQINAEILSNVWYSTTTINAGDTISIYAGFQNHSENNFSGTAAFYVDDLEIKKIDFTSNSKSLIKLEAQYKVVAGSHIVQVKILNVNNLLETETEKKDLIATQPATKETSLEQVMSVANKVTDTANHYADTLANYVESFKTPTQNSLDSVVKANTLIPNQNLQGEVLGISTKNIPIIKNSASNSPFLNPIIDLAVFFIKHWVWVLFAILLFILYLIFT